MINYNEFEAIVLKDPLADFLGTFSSDTIEYSYGDCVKFAGHSCPTVVGAFLMAKVGLKKLYTNEIPVRGEILVELKDNISSGVTGVIGNVIAFITGAANEGGFKGIGGKFDRSNKLKYSADIEGEVRLTRLDTNKSVDLSYNPSSIGGNPKQQQLMQKMIQGLATKEEKIEFGNLWQERVFNILNADIDQVIKSW